MAIEFHCRFCNAMIRVPDNAGGGKGRCPKCAVRITVPKKSTPKPTGKSRIEEEPFILPEAAEETIDSPLSIAIREPMVAGTVPVVFDSAEVTKPQIDVFPVERSSPALPIGSATRRLQQRKRRNRSRMIATAVVLTIFAAAGYFLYPRLLAERLTGELIAGTAETLELRPVLIEKSRVKLSSEELAELLKKLERTPRPLNSNSIQIQLTGTPKGLQVSVAAGAQSHFYRVSVHGNEAVQKYLHQHISELEEQRSMDIDRAATAFFIEYQRVLAKQSPAESITLFRDSLALPSLVGGLGHQLVAAYGRGLYRCVYEDREGGLYFLLPVGAKEFELIGRQHADGSVVVPAEFKVKVQGEIAQPKKPSEKQQGE